ARCRQLHLKCDRVAPTCGRCLSASKTCSSPNLKIRETNERKFRFTKKQKWVKTPRRLVFINESQTTINDALSSDSGPDEVETAWESPTGASRVPFLGSPPSTADIPSFRPQPLQDRLRLMMISSVVNPPSSSWPLTNPEEARLFRHFVEHLARWLDLCDPNHTFEIIVPQLARDSPVLLKAIFAVSARHWGQTHSDDHLKRMYNQRADMYNEECISIMKDILNRDDYQSGWTEHLFASTIILQVMEEMNAALHDDDTDAGEDSMKEAVRRGHLPGMYQFVRDASFEPGTLGAASFWVGLRQEIYSAVTKRRSVCLEPGPRLMDRSLDEADDNTWANRAVVHCSEVINYCFGTESHQLSQWDRLDKWNGQWSERRPPSYDPVFSEPPDSAVFPEIWYHRGCQVIGVQHHRLAKLFLLEHRIKSGNARTPDETYEVQSEIRKTVREICGIGRGNQWTPPGMFTACMTIAAFGGYFHTIEEQDAMLAILDQTQKDHARPTESVRLDMLRLWRRQI
ncbi:hypothetical protein N657DRAFT_578711, partial [Parathielavia appendiculata]